VLQWLTTAIFCVLPLCTAAILCAAVQATPTADTAMFYFYTNQLHFTPEFLGRVQLAGSVARLAGAQSEQR
jgi:hypothetical protein